MTTLVSLDVNRRLKEKAELEKIQKYEMGLKQTNHSKYEIKVYVNILNL